MRRALVSLVIAAFASAALVSSAAASPDPETLACPRMGSAPAGTTFAVRGPGEFLGGWKVSAQQASLCVRGETPGGATVAGSWTSPWARRYSVSADLEFEVANPSVAVSYSVALRLQVRGEGWTRWFEARHGSAPPVGVAGEGIGVGVAFACKGTCHHHPQMRWGLRVTLAMPGQAAIDMRTTAATR